MSVRHVPQIDCDGPTEYDVHCPCGATYPGRDRQTVDQVRAAAAEDGWTRHPRQDRCPTCSEQGVTQ